MRIRVGLAGIGLIGCLAVGCGGEVATMTAPPAAEPTTTRAATTTTSSSTTTTSTSTTTTTTVPPWTTLPEPERPPVLLGGLADEPVETVCLEVSNAGLPPVEENLPRDAPQEMLGRGLASFGLEVSETGECDATLNVVLEMRRTSASYEEVGRCWPGVEITMEASVLIDGQRRASWDTTEEIPPPFSISWCPKSDDPVDWHYLFQPGFNSHWNDLKCEPFTDLFGDLGAYVTCWWYAWERDTAPTGEELAWFAWWSFQDPFSGASIINNTPDEWSDTFLPLVPYVIRGDWNPSDPQEKRRHERRVEALAAITGITFDSPEEAWAWWVANQP